MEVELTRKLTQELVTISDACRDASVAILKYNALQAIGILDRMDNRLSNVSRLLLILRDYAEMPPAGAWKFCPECGHSVDDHQAGCSLTGRL